MPVAVRTVAPRGKKAITLRTTMNPSTAIMACWSMYASLVFGSLSKGKAGLQLVFVHKVCNEMRMRVDKAIMNRAPNHSKLKFLRKPKRPPRLDRPVAWLGLGMAFLPWVSSSSLTASLRAAIRADWRVGVGSGLGAVNTAEDLEKRTKTQTILDRDLLSLLYGRGRRRQRWEKFLSSYGAYNF